MRGRPKAYLAGPDVFLPDAPEHARRKVAICARHGITGRPPLNEDAESLESLPDERGVAGHLPQVSWP